MYKVRAIKQFSDLSSPKAPLRKVGDEWEVDTPERLMGLLGMNDKRVKYAQFVSSTKPESLKREGKQIIIRQGYLYFIGGVETFLYNLTKTYRNKNITILCDMIEPAQIVRLSQYADIKIDNHKPVKCDILILGNYDGGNILDRVTADKVYQMVHADLAAMSKHYKINARMPARVDKVICVSDTSKEGVKPYYTGEAEVIYNILRLSSSKYFIIAKWISLGDESSFFIFDFIFVLCPKKEPKNISSIWPINEKYK